MLVIGLGQYLPQRWIVAGIVASLVWFLAGKQSLSNGKPDAAIGWQCVAVILILIVCGGAFVKGEWIGLALGIGVLWFEVRSIRRISAGRST